jgi:F-type H+-transporting ATPase subunit alpha
MPLEKQVMIIYAVTNGFLDDLPIEKMGDWEEAFHRFMGTKHPEIGESITREKDLSEETTSELRDAIREFKGRLSL